MRDLSVPLAALYLRGLARPVEVPRAGWPVALRALRRAACALEDSAEALRSAGLWAEALLLDERRLVEAALQLWSDGEALTAADPGYPARWLGVLGTGAPPALWRRGEVPLGPSVSLAGSRSIGPDIRAFCRDVGGEAARLGYTLVSGGAVGCDREGASGALGGAFAGGSPGEGAFAGGALDRGASGRGALAGAVVEVLPFGVDLAPPSPACRLSVAPLGAEFSTAQAMERNALLYAASPFTILGGAKLRVGGAWHGAAHALRHRLSQVLVRASAEPGSRALVALGGAWLARPSDLEAILAAPPAPVGLFDQAV